MAKELLKLFFIFLSINVIAATDFNVTEFNDKEKEMLSRGSEPFHYPSSLLKKDIEQLKSKYSLMITEYHDLIQDFPAWKEEFPDKERRIAEVYAALLVENFNKTDETKKYNDIFYLDGGIEILKNCKNKINEDYLFLIYAKYLENFQIFFKKYINESNESSKHLLLIIDFTKWLKSIPDKDIAFMILNSVTSLAESKFNDNNYKYLVSQNYALATNDSESIKINELQVNYITHLKNYIQYSNVNSEVYQRYTDDELAKIIEIKKDKFRGTDFSLVIEFKELLQKLENARNSGDAKFMFEVIDNLNNLSFKITKILTAEKDIRYFNLFNKFLIDGTKTHHFINIGDYEKAKQIEINMFSYLDELLTLMKENLDGDSVFLGGKDPGVFSYIVRWLPYSSLAGNDNEIINIYEKLIKFTYGKDEVGLKTTRAILLEQLSRVYSELGNYEHSLKLTNEARQISFETGQFSDDQLNYHVGYNLSSGNLTEALAATKMLYERCLDTNSESYYKNLNCGPQLEVNFLILNSINNFYPQYKKETENLSFDEINYFFLDKNIMLKSEEASKLFINAMKIYQASEELKLITELDNPNYLEVMFAIEPTINTYSQFPQFYDDRKIWLAYISKIYINHFIILLTDIKSFSKKDYDSAIESSSNLLRNIANILYEVEDYESLNTLLKLIKESEYSEFIMRNSDSDISKINYSDEELIFKSKIKILQADLMALKKLDLNSENFASYKLNIEQKISYLNKIISTLNEPSLDNLNISEKFTKVNSNELLIQYLVSKNTLYAYLTNHNGQKKQILLSENFRALRLKILELNRMINKNTKIDDSLLNEVSMNILPESFELVSNSIKHLKLVADDVLHLIPFDILTFHNKNILEHFSISDVVQFSNIANIVNDSSLNIFYAQNSFVNERYKFSALPSVDEEAAYIKKYAKNKFNEISIFPDEFFNEESLLKSLKDEGSNIHISTHVKASGSSYDQVVMMLGNDSVVNLKSLDESINKTPLNMLVLSACDTAELRMDAQSKVFTGMSTFFHKKGAKNIISSLWSIDDKATSIFMALLYDIYANNNIDWSTAMKHTKNYFRTGKKPSADINISIDTNTQQQIKSYSHPYYWAAFQLSTTN